MAQTRQSRTTKLPNGNRVTITTGYNRSGYYRTVTVRRPDGTSDSRTDRKNIGFLNTGLFNVSGGYSNDIPNWARGPSRGSSAAAPPNYRARRIAVALVVALIALVGVVGGIWRHFNRSAYQDGRNWALRWEAGPLGSEPFPGCKLKYMTSNGYVQTDQSIFNDRVTGDGKPHDNYTKWRAGCESARSSY